MTARSFHIGTALVVMLALLLRVVFLLGMDVQTHIAGDINQYVHYAWNLGQHGVYSSAPINHDTPPPADNFRPPGYSFFLLLAMWLSGLGASWITLAHALQILLSVATVLITILLGREWMRPGFSLSAGALLAVWPHHIVFASTLLSETLLGFFLILALWLTALAHRQTSASLAVLAGLAFGYAALVNTAMLLFPPLLACMLLMTRRRTLVAPLLLSFMLLPATWWFASPSQHMGAHSTASTRASMNLVQGSWPQYHLAWRTQDQNETSHLILEAINAEAEIMANDPVSGLRTLVQRMSHDPIWYARWYLLEKPWLLWDWDIRLGWRGIYFLHTEASPFERHPILRAIGAALKTLNPVVFALAAIAVFFLLAAWARQAPAGFPALSTAIFAVYVTIIHTILQAEPRYAIAYRPEQLLLACTAIALISKRVGLHIKPRSE